MPTTLNVNVNRDLKLKSILGPHFDEKRTRGLHKEVKRFLWAAFGGKSALIR